MYLILSDERQKSLLPNSNHIKDCKKKQLSIPVFPFHSPLARQEVPFPV